MQEILFSAQERVGRGHNNNWTKESVKQMWKTNKSKCATLEQALQAGERHYNGGWNEDKQVEQASASYIYI